MMMMRMGNLARVRRAVGPTRMAPMARTPLGRLGERHMGGGRASSAAKEASGAASMGLSTTNKMLFGYITFGLAAMAAIARVKDGDADDEESVRVYNMAKRAVAKDRRFFEAIGYPKEFELIAPEVTGATADALRGSFRVHGDKGSAFVAYALRPQQAEEEESGAPQFDLLQVRLEDATEFSAVPSYEKSEDIVRQQQATSLGKKLMLPVMGGVVIGGVCSFLVIRILRNRPFYVHKLALDHVNNSDVARMYLGHPITSNRKEYVGKLTDMAANYTVTCKGPKGEGKLIVKAHKDADPDAANDTSLTTPGTDWKFSTLVLAVKRNELRKEKDKTAKTIDLLADQPPRPTSVV